MDTNQVTDYLKKLMWDTNIWTVISGEDYQKLQDKDPAKVNLVPIKDRQGKKAFGDGAAVAKIEFVDRHLNNAQGSSPKPEAPVAEKPAPPEPVKEEPKKEVPAPPPVPQKLQEVAKESENVEVVTMPKNEEKSAETKKELSQELKDRIASLLKLRFQVDQDDSTVLIAPDEEHITHEDLEEMDEFKWTKYHNSYVTLINAKPGQEKALREAQERQKKRRENDVQKIKEKESNDKPEEKVEQPEPAKSSEKVDEKNEDVSEKKQDVETVSSDESGEIEVSEEASNILEHNSDVAYASATSVFFTALTSIGFQQLNISINKLNDDKFSVIVKPNNFSGDPALDEIRPLTLTGTADDLDEGFLKAITTPLEKVHGVMLDSKQFLDDLAAKEKKTKAAAEKKKKVDKLVEKAKKYHDDKDFDSTKKISLTTAKKKWDDVLELDPENSDAKKGMEKLDKQIQEQEETLDLK